MGRHPYPAETSSQTMSQTLRVSNGKGRVPRARRARRAERVGEPEEEGKGEPPGLGRGVRLPGGRGGVLTEAPREGPEDPSERQAAPLALCQAR